MTISVAPAGQQEFLGKLLSGGHLLPSGEPGLYGRGMLFERARAAFDDLVTRTSAQDQPETPRFPPLIPKQVLEKAGYLRSFPQLAGAVFSFAGDESAKCLRFVVNLAGCFHDRRIARTDGCFSQKRAIRSERI